MAATGDSRAVRTTPWQWRAALLGIVFLLGVGAYVARQQGWIGLRVVSAVGLACLLGVAAAISRDLKSVNWQTIALGVALQFGLALFILRWEIADFRPGYYLFEQAGQAVKKFNEFSLEGAKFVFGILADKEVLESEFGPARSTIVAFQALTPIIFISAFFTLLYYFGVLQAIVRFMARLMMYLLKTSGAETLSAAANVFMGQTEAPLIVKPYIARMTQSELLTMMTGGMATISGALLATYASFGADPVALLATSVMAAPCSLYLSKLVYPETEQPETSGVLAITDERPYANAIDALAAGATDGMRLAINVVAMLIAFLATLALVDYLLANHLVSGQSLLKTLSNVTALDVVLSATVLLAVFVLGCKLANGFLARREFPRIHELLGTQNTVRRILGWFLLFGLFLVFLVAANFLLAWLPGELRLKDVFAAVFSPLAFLIGTPEKDIVAVANLLGTKIAANEFVAYLEMQSTYLTDLDPRSVILCTYALTGFANFGSVGIQIGGIGALAPDRRSDLARLGMMALLIGFLVTCINASVAGILL